ncbi:MAG: META domain-containing protein [Phycisphaerales bacterium JB060]
MRTILLTALAIATLALLGCTTSTQPTEPAADASAIGAWSLTKIEDERYDLPSGARSPTLTITESGRLSGQAGINRFSGSTDADALEHGEWNPGGIVTTRMGGEPEALAFEQQYVSRMQRADTIAVGPQWLELRIGSRPLLRFARSGQ